MWNKILMIMNKFIVLGIALLTVVATSAETIWVNGNKITGTTSLSTGGGTVSYNASTKVLTINNVVCDRSGSDKNGIDCKDVTNLTINMTGTNSLKANNASSVVCGGTVTINIASGVTNFISTAGSQNAIGMYGCNLTLTGAGKLYLQSDNGSAIQGREGVSSLKMKIAYCDIKSSSYDLYNISQWRIYGSSSSSTDRGLTSTTYVHMHPHSSSSITHVKDCTPIDPNSGSLVSMKQPDIANVFDLNQTQYATKDVVITDESVASNYVTINGYIFENSNEDEAILVGPTVGTKYTATNLLIPGFVTINGVLKPVVIRGEAFKGLTNLTQVKLAYGVKTINSYAFYNCTNLQSINLPSSLSYIGADFVLGTKVKTIYWTTLNPGKVNYSNLAFRSYDSTKGTMYFPNMNAVSQVTSDDILKYYTLKASNECYEVEIENKSNYDKYRYVITKAATATSNGEMALVGVSPNQSTFAIDLDKSSSLTNYLCSYKYDVSYGDNRTYDLTAIAAYALYGNTRLTTVKLIAPSIRSIGQYAFRSCSNLTAVEIGTGVSNMDIDAFASCGKIESVTWNAFGHNDFSNGPFRDAASSLTSASVGSSVSILPDKLFGSCDKIRMIRWEIPDYDDFTSADEAPFYESRGSVLSMIFESGVLHIPAYFCTGYRKLDYLSIPSSLQSIGYGAFANCYSLTSVILTDHVTYIGNTAFYGCSGLTSVTIPKSVTSIGSSAFSRCSGLTSVTIPGSVTSIGDEAFYGCSGLTSITIPNSVTKIGYAAFRGSTGLTRIDAYPNPAKVSMGSDVFYNVPKDGTLHVLPKYLSAYQNAIQWKDFFNIRGDLGGVILGDVNGDDNVDITDVVAIANFVMGSESDNFVEANADMNGDNSIDVTDVVALANQVMGL